MRKLASSLLLCVSSAVCIAAPATEDSIKTLFVVMKTEALLNSVYASMEPAMRQALAKATAGKELTEEQRRVMDRAPQRMSEVLRRELNWSKMEPIQILIYRETFEQAEIDGLIAFYRSPLGQSFVAKMPQVSQKGMVAMQAYLEQVMPSIKAEMDEILKEAKLPRGQ